MAKRFAIRVIKATIFRLYNILGRLYLAPMLFLEWKRPDYNRISERSIEYGFALRQLSKICPKEVLDIGPGKSAWPHLMANCGFLVTAIDQIKGYWKGSFFNRHYYIINDDIVNPKIKKQFDFITCISVLEHIPDHKAAIKGMVSLLKPGGHIVLTIPYKEDRYVDNVYKLEGAGYGQNAPYICQVFSGREIGEWFNENPIKIIEQEYYEVFSGDLWTFGERIYPSRKVEKGEKCHLICLVIQKTGALVDNKGVVRA
jgi:2-polyprenyl-3-methyl-5-hydroxy-6-metoxy-1,4-benzoquinol methylase